MRITVETQWPADDFGRVKVEFSKVKVFVSIVSNMTALHGPRHVYLLKGMR